ADGLDIAVQDRGRRPIGLDERDVAGTTRERLQPYRAGAGVEVEHLGAVQVEQPAERTEQRLARPVGRGPGAPRRDEKPAPLGRAGNYSCHRPPLIVLTPSPGTPLRRRRPAWLPARGAAGAAQAAGRPPPGRPRPRGPRR